MSAALLAPLGLAALAALALPLLIHLARRTEQRPTDFAALRWLRPKPRPRRKPRLDERWLLAARLLLLALLAVFLARPILHGAEGSGRWLAVAPGVDAGAARAAAAGARAVWLAPGFPSVRAPAPGGDGLVVSLLRELDAGLPPGAALTVLVPAVLDGVDGERPRLSRPVAWRVAAGRASARSAPTEPAPPPALELRAALGREGEVRYLRAAATAWSAAAKERPSGSQAVSGTPAPTTPPTAGIAWWSASPLPEDLRRRVRDGAAVLLSSDAPTRGFGAATPLWRDTAGAVLVEGGASGRGRWRRFTRPLTPETAPELLDDGFPARLRALVAPPPAPPGRVRAEDLAPLVGARSEGVADTDLRPALALAVVAAFALERALATRRRRAVGP